MREREKKTFLKYYEIFLLAFNFIFEHQRYKLIKIKSKIKRQSSCFFFNFSSQYKNVYLQNPRASSKYKNITEFAN